MDEQMVNVALALVGIVSILANTYAYSKRKDADSKAEAAKAEAAEAKATAEQMLTLANAINRAVDEWGASEKRAAEDRKHFTRVMEANAVQKGKLAQAVEANTATLTGFQSVVASLPGDVATKVKEVFEPVLERLDAIAADVTETRQTILLVFGDDEAENG